MATRSAKKRQARLTFSPLPSSSPAASSYNQQIRDRAAAVSLDSPRAVKRRKVQDAPGIQTYLEPRSSATNVNDLPSPQATNSPPRKPRPTTTTKTTFFGSQHSNQRGSERPVKKQTKKQITVLDDSDDSESDETTPTTNHRIGHSQQAPVSLLNGGNQNSIRQSTRSEAVSLAQSDSDSESLPSTPLARTRKPAAAQGAKSSPLQIDSDSDDVRPMRSSGRSKRRSSPIRDEDDLPRSSARRIRPARRRNVEESPGEVESAEPAVGTDSDDEEDMPRSSARRTRRVRPRSDEDVSEEAEDEVVEISSEEEVEEDEPLPKRKRTLTRVEQQEIDDDLQDLKSSSPGTLDGRPRSSQRSKHASALEKLKRRRAGQQIAESEEEEEEQSDDSVTVVASSSHNMFRPDEDDEGFLEDDDDDTLGVPAGIPLKFTRYATSSAKDLFRYAVEWMVQKKLNPAFLMNDEIYKLTFDKLDDEVTGLAGSKFISAIWAPKFSLALRARPQIGLQLIDRGSGDYLKDKCDACNRTGHPATWQVQFVGRPYNKTSLEEIATKEDEDDSDSDDSSDSDSDSDGGTHDAEGRQIPPQSTIFFVGKFCKANAETAHALTHWRWHLYDWIVDYLTTKGHNTPEMIVKRDSWSERKRRKRANKIVDAMEDEGKIKELYNDFKSQIKDARFSKQGRFDNSHE